jgi:hypothetical protein
MKVLFLYADSEKEYNCTHWRSYLPSSFLARFAGWETVMYPVKEIINLVDSDIINGTDILFVERLLSHDIFLCLDIIRAKTGAKIIFDMDDSYKNMEYGSQPYDFWINGIVNSNRGKSRMKYPPIEQVSQYAKNVDAISSPSKLILEDWKDYNDNLLWLPNFADADLYSQIPYREDKKVVIGWGGGGTHYTSWYSSGLITALRRIYDIFKGRVSLLLITRDEQLKYKLKEFRPTCVETDRLLYPKEIQNIDIALAPVSGEYDRRRSWLKISEYSLSGIPWIGSDLDPYREYNFPGSIITRNKPADWYEAIAEMIENRTDYYTKVQKEGYPLWRKAFAIQENHEFLVHQFKSIKEIQ